MPLFTKVEYAPTISYTDRSNVPKHIEGTGSSEFVIPIFLAKSKTEWGPNCFMMYAVIVFIEFASPKRKFINIPS